ncbi:MAG: hypothetical protein JKY93_12710 [Gammaproteobacteria bacterium]|nr:hypothetical protein [Gammaproteobacteria bacterium]
MATLNIKKTDTAAKVINMFRTESYRLRSNGKAGFIKQSHNAITFRSAPVDTSGWPNDAA